MATNMTTDELEKELEEQETTLASVREELETLQELAGRVRAQSQRIVDAAVYPSINAADELAKLLDLVQELPELSQWP